MVKLERKSPSKWSKSFQRMVDCRGTAEILDCIKERNKFKLNGNISAYKDLRNKIKDLIETAKKKTYESKIEEGKSDPRTIWKLFKEFGIKDKGNNGVENFCLKNENDLITNESDLTEMFNNYFVNVASKLKEPIVNSEFDNVSVSDFFFVYLYQHYFSL